MVLGGSAQTSVFLKAPPPPRGHVNMQAGFEPESHLLILAGGPRPKSQVYYIYATLISSKA